MFFFFLFDRLHLNNYQNVKLRLNYRERERERDTSAFLHKSAFYLNLLLKAEKQREMIK